MGLRLATGFGGLKPTHSLAPVMAHKSGCDTSNRNLLSFKDIRRNGYHIETMNHNGNEYLLITRKKQIFEQLISSSYGLYQTNIRPLESHAIMNQKFNDPKAFLLWR